MEALEGFISDVTDRKESEKQIQRQVQRFEALRKIDIAITASLDQRVTFDILLDQVTTQLVWMLPVSFFTTLPHVCWNSLPGAAFARRFSSIPG